MFEIFKVSYKNTLSISKFGLLLNVLKPIELSELLICGG